MRGHFLMHSAPPRYRQSGVAIAEISTEFLAPVWYAASGSSMKILIWVDKRHVGERSLESVLWTRLSTPLHDFDKHPVPNICVCLAELRVLFTSLMVRGRMRSGLLAGTFPDVGL